MDKIDLLITSAVVSIMITCFYLHSNWSFFCAGICAAALFVINVGRIAHLAGRKQQEDQWQHFINNLDGQMKQD